MSDVISGPHCVEHLFEDGEILRVQIMRERERCTTIMRSFGRSGGVLRPVRVFPAPSVRTHAAWEGLSQSDWDALFNDGRL